MASWAQARSRWPILARRARNDRTAATHRTYGDPVQSHRRALQAIEQQIGLADRELRKSSSPRSEQVNLIRRMTALHDLAFEQRLWLEEHVSNTD